MEATQPPNMQAHETMGEANLAISDALDRATEDGRYLVGVWSVDSDGLLHMRTLTTWKFPEAGFFQAMRMFQADAAARHPRPAPLVPSPLPTATLPPLKN